MLFFRSLLESMTIKMPMRAIIGEKFSGFSILIQILSLWMPERLKIQEVSVVPILAPKITLRVWENSMIPELTRPTSITVTADEDWTAMVITAPRIMLITGLDVIFFSRCSSLPPAIFSRLPDITFMPNRKNARPPIRVMNEKIVIYRFSLALFCILFSLPDQR